MRYELRDWYTNAIQGDFNGYKSRKRAEMEAKKIITMTNSKIVVVSLVEQVVNILEKGSL